MVWFIYKRSRAMQCIGLPERLADCPVHVAVTELVQAVEVIEVGIVLGVVLNILFIHVILP